MVHQSYPAYTKKVIGVPLIGFGTKKTKEWWPLIEPILSRENIQLREFIIRELPEISSEGGKRPIICVARNLKFLESGKDEMHKEKYKMEVSFELAKGSYATVFVHQLCTEFGEYPF